MARIIGIAKAKELIFTARRLKAEEAVNWGILNYVEDDYESAYNRAIKLSEEILKNVKDF